MLWNWVFGAHHTHFISFLVVGSSQLYVIESLVCWWWQWCTKWKCQNPTNYCWSIVLSLSFPLYRLVFLFYLPNRTKRKTKMFLGRIEHIQTLFQPGEFIGMHVKHFVRLKLLTLIFYLWANRRKYKHDRRTTKKSKQKWLMTLCFELEWRKAKKSVWLYACVCVGWFFSLLVQTHVGFLCYIHKKHFSSNLVLKPGEKEQRQQEQQTHREDREAKKRNNKSIYVPK